MDGNAGNDSSKKHDAVETEGEEVYTWDDIVQIDKEAEKDAEALLGGQDDMVCSYPEGYKYRQPLYSCRTCATQSGQQAGVCYACSLNCHDGHDLIELYTKRKFCCDCGNSKFKDKCKLFEEKDKVNARNVYSHNFDQLYCTCNQPYPPPEDATDELEDMHQCCICEDWFHLSHIYNEPDEKMMLEKLMQHGLDNACDLVCKGCVTKLPFLMCYRSLAMPTVECEDSTASEINISAISLPVSEDKNPDDPQTSSECKIEKQWPLEGSEKPHTIYFEGVTWREQLCRCSKCMMLYEDLNCTFLLDPEDTMAFYDLKRHENMALKGETSLKLDEPLDMANKVYEIVVKKTNNRDAALHAYLAVDEMSKHVTEFFQGLDHGKVVTKDDVEKCFQELKAKRPRLDLASSSESAWTQ